MSKFATTGKTERVVVAWTAGTVTLKAAVTGKQVRLLGGLVFAGAAGGTVKLISNGASDTDLSGVITVAANGKLLDRIDETGFCETIVGEGLQAVVTGAFNGVLLVQTIG